MFLTPGKFLLALTGTHNTTPLCRAEWKIILISCYLNSIFFKHTCELFCYVKIKKSTMLTDKINTKDKNNLLKHINCCLNHSQTSDCSTAMPFKVQKIKSILFPLASLPSNTLKGRALTFHKHSLGNFTFLHFPSLTKGIIIMIS